MSDQTNQNQKKWVLIATILASGVVFLSGSVVNVALPKIASGLNTGLSGLQWVIPDQQKDDRVPISGLIPYFPYPNPPDTSKKRA